MFRRVTIAALFLLLIYGTAVRAQTEPYTPEIDPANFVEKVDHPYFPLVVGTTMVYESQSEDGLERTEVTVLPETREVMGVVCMVVRDSVWLEGELIEDTFDWFAQDTDGNVWYMGEDSHEYENGVAVSNTGSWEAGVDGALPGIMMEANPQIGDSYRQEYYAGEAEDMAEVIDVAASASTPFGTFENLLVTRDWNPLEAGAGEYKYYAQGIGLVLEEAVEGSGRTELAEVNTRDMMGDDEVDDDGETDDENDDLVEAPNGTPIISEEQALAAAEVTDASEIELENEGGRWVYSIETEAVEVTVDAITGEVLGTETDDD